MRSSLHWLALAVASLTIQPALAQPRASSHAAMHELAVTTQRALAEEGLQETPVSVTALSSQMLDARGIIGPSDLQMAVPNVSFTATNFGGASFSIRGVGRLGVAASGESGVSFHQNQIPVAVNLNTLEFYDVERVEVLRGPQGGLYGRNATGGAVNMATRMPSYGAIDGFVDAERGDYGHERYKGALNLPLGSAMGLRVAFMSLKRDGYTKNMAATSLSTMDGSRLPGLDGDLDGRDLFAYRGTWALDFSDNGRLWVQYSRFEEDDDRARFASQVCKRSDTPAFGCEPDGEGFDSPHLGASTAGLMMMTNQARQDKISGDAFPAGAKPPDLLSPATRGEGGAPAHVVLEQGALPLGASGDGTYVTRDHVAPEMDMRTAFTDYEPVFQYEEDLWTFGLEYDFEQLSLSILGAYQEDSYMSRSDHSMDVGPILHPAPASAAGVGPGYPEGRWPTSMPGGPSGAAPGDCAYADGRAGVFGGCVAGDDGRRLFSLEQVSRDRKYWTAEFRLVSDLENPVNFQLGYSIYRRERLGKDHHLASNGLDAAGLVGLPLASDDLQVGGLVGAFVTDDTAFQVYPSLQGAAAAVEKPSIHEGEALFSEVYWDVADRVKLTAGLRYSKDRKTVSDASGFLTSINQNELLAPILQEVALDSGEILCVDIFCSRPVLVNVLTFYPGQSSAENQPVIDAAIAQGKLDPDFAANLALLPGRGDDPLDSSSYRWARGASLHNAGMILTGADHDYGRTSTGGGASVKVAPGAYTAEQRRQFALFGISEAQIAAAEMTPAFSRERVELAIALGPVTARNEARRLSGNPDEDSWTGLSGRLGLDWQVNDNLLVFGFLSQGYKPGGFNPALGAELQGEAGYTYGKEEVQSIELGAKTSLLGGDLVLHGSVFFSDYTGLQTGRIRSGNAAFNENLDADIQGAELEVLWRPSFMQSLSIDGAFSWLDTAVQDVESVDVLNRTAGQPGWVNLKNIDPGPGAGAQFIAYGTALTDDMILQAMQLQRNPLPIGPNPYPYVGDADDFSSIKSPNALSDLNSRAVPGAAYGLDVAVPEEGRTIGIPVYWSRDYLRETLEGGSKGKEGAQGAHGGPEPEAAAVDCGEAAGGACVSDGIPVNLNGKQLPNSPEFTARLGLQYTLPSDAIRGALSFRWDYYWQDDSYAREFNTVGDRIAAWDQHNFSVIYESLGGAWQIRAWVRNLEDKDNVTGKFLSSDSSGYFRNYFLTEPRLYGLTAHYSFARN